MQRFTLFSIIVHAVVITSLLIAQVFAVGALPTPRRPLSFDNIRMVQLADIELPAPPRRTTHPESSSASVSPGAAPIAAPDAVTPETDSNARRGLRASLTASSAATTPLSTA
jgi:hypothetical protein